MVQNSTERMQSHPNWDPYRQYKGDEHTIQSPKTPLSRIGDHGEQIVCGGDFNLSGPNWKYYILKQNCHFSNQQCQLRNIIEKDLTQVVTEPTPGNNTLNLFLINIPANVMKITVTLCIS